MQPKDKQSKNGSGGRKGEPKYSCSFCGRSNVSKLFRGDGAYICNECIAAFARQKQEPNS